MSDQTLERDSVADTALDEHQVRLQKIEQLQALGVQPWPERRQVTATCAQVASEFIDDKPAHYAVAGRVMTIRLHGKALFAHIQDRSGRLQIYLRADDVGAQMFDFFNKFIDSGDIIWASGDSFRTHKGEVSLKVHEFSLLSKCLYPLPEKFHGITDQETKYRQRYLDLMTSAETRERFVARSKIVRGLRHYLDGHDFIEVETPMLHPILGGASARPFVTYHNTLDTDFYLRIAPELYLKRLVVGGLERVYEINRNFRNEGISTRHNPEFTTLEYYMAHENYHFAMDFLENMIRYAVNGACGSLQVPFGQLILDFGAPFKRLSMRDAVIQIGGVSAAQLEPGAIDEVLAQHKIVLEDAQASNGQKLFALFEALVEHRLEQPTFIIDYPVEVSPLAKCNENRTDTVARFELFVAGFELANGFNELNDPFDQAERFRQQEQARDRGDTEAQHYDADFVQALEYGLPPTVGVGMGIDRLTMLLTNTTSIKEVILFPTLRKK